MSGFDPKAYQARFDALAAKGVDVHGEATFVRSFQPRSVLDAGCGTGRVALELARHGIEVIGVDVDEAMIAQARLRAPELDFRVADLARLELDRTFDVVVLAGNVPIFCPEPDRDDLVGACAAHVSQSGVMIAGFQLGRGYELDAYDDALGDAGMEVTERWSSWDRSVFDADSDYVVSVALPASP